MSPQTQSQTFKQLALAKPLLKGVSEAGFEQLTAIQAHCLPAALAGRDVAGQAQTGTGKTAAFLLALFQRLLERPAPEARQATQPRAFIVAPTRELAIQIHRDACELGRHCGQKIVVVYGGAGYERQKEKLAAGVDVLIGTPGRLIDFHKQHLYDLKMVEVAVLDEADRMFDLGFIRDIRYLLRRLPPPVKRLTMLFSATLSWRVMELAHEHMRAPEFVRIDPEQVTAASVKEKLFFPAMEEKPALLIGLVQKLQPERAMIFVNTRRTAERLTATLVANDFKARALSGDVPQKKRLTTLAAFEGGDINLLVTTDVASRGLHIPAVSHVFNYDLPQDAEDYVHRIGRTGRAGASGEAIGFACETHAFSLPDIERYIGHEIPRDFNHADLLATGIKRAPARLPGHKGKGHPRGRRRDGKDNRRQRNPRRK
ncbi:MAG: DEAD/DEAH box helicase [Gammaproteobacteria bacterium]|nr:DEAD/DEAH box helicase [Gammaproteobacteria bacterium]